MIKSICNEIIQKIEKEHIREIADRELLLISSQYPGLWLEHAYDAVLYAGFDKTKVYLAKNTIEVFIDNQKEDGQYPFCVIERDKKNFFGYSQIQECVSFLTLAKEARIPLCHHG